MEIEKVNSDLIKYAKIAEEVYVDGFYALAGFGRSSYKSFGEPSFLNDDNTITAPYITGCEPEEMAEWFNGAFNKNIKYGLERTFYVVLNDVLARVHNVFVFELMRKYKIESVEQLKKGLKEFIALMITEAGDWCIANFEKQQPYLDNIDAEIKKIANSHLGYEDWVKFFA